MRSHACIRIRARAFYSLSGTKTTYFVFPGSPRYIAPLQRSRMRLNPKSLAGMGPPDRFWPNFLSETFDTTEKSLNLAYKTKRDCVPPNASPGWPSLTAVPVWDHLWPRRTTFFPPRMDHLFSVDHLFSTLYQNLGPPKIFV